MVVRINYTEGGVRHIAVFYGSASEVKAQMYDWYMS